MCVMLFKMWKYEFEINDQKALNFLEWLMRKLYRIGGAKMGNWAKFSKNIISSYGFKTIFFTSILSLRDSI